MCQSSSVQGSGRNSGNETILEGERSGLHEQREKKLKRCVWNNSEFRTTTSFEFVIKSYCFFHLLMRSSLRPRNVRMLVSFHQILMHSLTYCHPPPRASPATQRLPVLKRLQHFVNYITLCGGFDCLILMRMCLLGGTLKPSVSSRC